MIKTNYNLDQWAIILNNNLNDINHKQLVHICNQCHLNEVKIIQTPYYTLLTDNKKDLAEDTDQLKFANVNILQGQLIIKDKLINTAKEAHIYNLHKKENWMDAKGVFSYIHTDGKNLTIMPDILGLSQVYAFHPPGYFIAASNPILAAELIKIINPDYHEIDYESIYSTLAFETPHDDKIYIKGLNALPFGSYIKFNTQTGPKINCVIIDEIKNLKSKNHDIYNDYLNAGINEIRDNISAITNARSSNINIIYLSGGQDARVLMSLIIEAKQEHSFLYYTYGKQDEIDYIAAKTIRERFQLTQTGARGHSRSGLDFDISSTISWASYHIAGLRAFDSTCQPQKPPFNLGLYAGELGENFHGYYGLKTIIKNTGNSIGDTDEKSALYALNDRSFLSTFGPSMYLKPGDIKQSITKRLLDNIANIEWLGQINKYDAIYTIYRSRYHFGLGQRMRSANFETFPMLYSTKLFLASLLIPEIDRMQGSVCVDIINNTTPSLLDISGTYDWNAPLAKLSKSVIKNTKGRGILNKTADIIDDNQPLIEQKLFESTLKNESIKILEKWKDTKLSKTINTNLMQKHLEANDSKSRKLMRMLVSRDYVFNRIGFY